MTLLLAATAKNEPLWIHRGKVFYCLEAQSDVCPIDNDSLARTIDMLYWSYFPPLILDEPEKGDSSHYIKRSVKAKVKGDFTLSTGECLRLVTFGSQQPPTGHRL